LMKIKERENQVSGVSEKSRDSESDGGAMA